MVRVRGVDELAPHRERVEVIFAWNFDRPRLRDVDPARAASAMDPVDLGGGRGSRVPRVSATHGVVLTNAAGVYDPGLAESVLGFLLAFSARILEDARLRAGDWPSEKIALVRGTTALIVGAGSIGTETGRLLRSAGVRVRGVARTARPAGRRVRVDRRYRRLCRRSSPTADHVVNVLPITPATRRMFGAPEFAAMKPTALFVNIGRGATVDEPALIHALESGVIAGAALDVFEEEPLPAESPLWSMPNVLVSPHRAGDHEQWTEDVVALFVDNLKRFVAGEPLRNVVDVSLGYAPAGRSSGVSISDSASRR